MKAEIKAEELMIGNILQYQNGTTLMQGFVTSIPNGKKICIDHVPVKINTVIPIKLTPEILEKCGFKKNGTIYLYEQNGFYLAQGNAGFYAPFVVKTIIYVHSLQNLIYAITGTHLTIEL